MFIDQVIFCTSRGERGSMWDNKIRIELSAQSLTNVQNQIGKYIHCGIQWTIVDSYGCSCLNCKARRRWTGSETVRGMSSMFMPNMVKILWQLSSKENAFIQVTTTLSLRWDPLANLQVIFWRADTWLELSNDTQGIWGKAIILITVSCVERRWGRGEVRGSVSGNMQKVDRGCHGYLRGSTVSVLSLAAYQCSKSSCYLRGASNDFLAGVYIWQKRRQRDQGALVWALLTSTYNQQ